MKGRHLLLQCVRVMQQWNLHNTAVTLHVQYIDNSDALSRLHHITCIKWDMNISSSQANGQIWVRDILKQMTFSWKNVFSFQFRWNLMSNFQ